MTSAFAKLFITAGLILGFTLANANDIGPGSAPPPLDIKTWYKGTPISVLDKSKTYVIEFWATWCGPCIESIPHLSDLAKKNSDVTFIGVSVFENDKDLKIKNFVDKMGDKMAYNVGYSGNRDRMALSWCDAAGQMVIPTAFIIKNNVIQWIGLPTELDEPLQQVKNGTFKLAEFKAAYDKSAPKNRRALAISNQRREIELMIKAGKIEEAKSTIADFESKYPKEELDYSKFLLQSKVSPTAWRLNVKRLASKGDEATSTMLFYFAMEQTRKGGNLAQGNLVIEEMLKRVKRQDILVYGLAAEFYAETNDLKQAVALVDKSLRLLPTSNEKDKKAAKVILVQMKVDYTAMLQAQSKVKLVKKSKQ